MSSSGTCPAFDLQYPASVNCGPMTACPGYTIIAGDCADNTGNTVFRLYNAANKAVGSNIEGCDATGNSGSKIFYPVPAGSGCQDYTLKQACFTDGSCSGTTTYEVIPNPPSAAPTPYPSIMNVPTTANNGTCDPYATTGPDVVSCGPIRACSKDTVTVGDCGACGEQSSFTLYDSDGYFVSSDERCPGSTTCSLITYVVPDNTGCMDYTVRQGCYENAPCNGTTTYNVTHSTDPTPMPSFAPTAEPTAPAALVGLYEITDPNVPCGHRTGASLKNLDQCVQLDNTNGVRTYGIVHCDSMTVDSAWTVQAFSDSECTTSVGNGQGADACTCYALPEYGDDGADDDIIGFSVSVNCAADYSYDCPDVPSTVQKAFLTFYGADNCDGDSAGVPDIPLGACVSLTGEGQYAVLTCAGTTSDSAWTIKTYNTPSCTAQSLISTTVNDGNCACNSLNADYVDDYVNGVAMTLNCGSAVSPGSCSFGGASSNGLSSAALGGIVGGVLGFVLLATIVGLWIGGVFGGAASSAAAGTAAGGSGASGSAGTGAAATDVEMSVNPMAPPTSA